MVACFTSWYICAVYIVILPSRGWSLTGQLVVTTVEYEKLVDRRWATVEIKSLPRATLELIMENQLKSRGKVRT
jgi:hypothetical protein